MALKEKTGESSTKEAISKAIYHYLECQNSAEILVVEDNPPNMELIVEILKADGFIIDMAENGEEAVKKAETKIYDLILMDIKLPEMNGTEAMKLIKSKLEYKDKPVIALTAFAMKGDKDRFLSDGFDDYISKPINVSEFLKTVEKYDYDSPKSALP